MATSDRSQAQQVPAGEWLVMTKNASSYNRVLHYIPPAVTFADLPHEYIEPSPADSFIHWLYRYRCAECRMPGCEINEIIPRARSKKSITTWQNRILLCSSCHHKFHQNGVTKEKIEMMKSLQFDYLNSCGREVYAKQLNG